MKTPSTLLGLACGDSLGQPFEFMDMKKIAKLKWDGSFTAGMVWDLAPGKYTDDTLMSCAIAESLIEKNGFDGDNVALKYIDWVNSGDLRGIGLTCERAIYKLIAGVSIKESGKMQDRPNKPSFKIKRAGQDIKSNLLTGSGDFCGNGTVMRCAPIGLFYHNDLVKLEEAAKIDATITHDHPDARDASFVLCYFIAQLINGVNKFEIVNNLLSSKMELIEGSHVTTHIISAIKALDENLTLEDISGKLGWRGTAHETLASAVYCFLKYPTFKDSVVSSILIGGDTDTRAAIVGALAGSYYGLEGIPEEYVQGVEDSLLLQNLDKKLYNY